MLDIFILLRRLPGREANPLARVSTTQRFVSPVLFGDWDRLHVLHAPTRQDLQAALTSLDDAALDRRVVFAWDPLPDPFTPGHPWWTPICRNLPLFAYVELRLTPWLLHCAGAHGLQTTLQYIRTCIEPAFPPLPGNHSPPHAASRFLVGLGYADIVLILATTSFEGINDRITELRSKTFSDLRRSSPEGEELFSRCASHSSILNNHLIASTYTIFGYASPDHSSPRSLPPQDLLDKVEDSPRSTSSMRPAVFVSTYPGHEPRIFRALQAKHGSDVLKSIRTTPGSSDLTIFYDVDHSTPRRTFRWVLDTLSTLRQLNATHDISVAGTHTLWMSTVSREAEPEPHGHLFDYSRRRLDVPAERLYTLLRHHLGEDRSALLESLITTYNVTVTHPYYSMYVSDLGRFARQLLEALPDMLQRLTDPDAALAVSEDVEFLTRRLTTALMARTTAGTHALRSDVAPHPALGIQKVDLALRAVAEAITLALSDDGAPYAAIQPVIVPIGSARSLRLNIDKTHTYVLLEAAPDVLLARGLYRFIHDVCHHARYRYLSGA